MLTLTSIPYLESLSYIVNHILNLTYSSQNKKSYILHQKNLIFYIFITHQKSYILHKKRSHLTYLSHIRKITPENFISHIHIKNHTSYTETFLHIISSSKIKNITPEKSYISHRKILPLTPTSKFLHLILEKYYILYLHHIKILDITSENPTSYILITHQNPYTGKSYISYLHQKYYIYIIKAYILHITWENITSYILYHTYLEWGRG